MVRGLGEEVRVVGIVPQDTKERYERYLAHRDIGFSFYEVPGYTRINTTILEKDGRVTHLNTRNREGAPVQEDAILRHFTEQIQGGGLWALSGSLAPGLPANLYENLITAVAGKETGVLLDTSGPALKLGMKARPTMVKPNHGELEEFFGEEIRGIHHIALRGKRILDMGIEYVFISLGSDGMIALHGSDCLLCSIPERRIVDTVGCGDALVAGILVGRKKHFSFSEICRLAIACGVSNALHEGAGEVDGKEVWRLAEDVSVTAV